MTAPAVGDKLCLSLLKLLDPRLRPICRASRGCFYGVGLLL